MIIRPNGRVRPVVLGFWKEDREMRQYSGVSPDEAHRFLDDIVRVLDEFEQGGMNIERLQSALESCAATLDNGVKEVLDELRVVDTDLETILFMTPAQDRSAAARERVRDLRRISRVKLSR